MGEGYGKCMFVHAYIWHTRVGGARFIVFICSWPTETTPRLSSLRDCCCCPTVPKREGGRQARLLSCLNAGPKRYCIMSRTALKLLLLLFPLIVAAAVAAATAGVIYNLNRSESQTSVKCSTKLGPCLLFIK